MSSTIWTQCAGKSRLTALSADAWRLVEDQSRISTRKLVDSDAEQLRLEELIETAKPPIPQGSEWAHLHYLLFTPFRYPPPPHGSRFRTPSEAGVWYGSRVLDTAIAEVAYWRLRFLNDVQVDIQSEVFLTAFMIKVRSKKAIDLTSKPFSTYEQQISNKTSYAESQALGAAMRAEGVELFQYTSARDRQRGVNIGVFSPQAFVSKTVSDASRETWHCFATKDVVEFRWQSFTKTKQLRFQRDDFEVHGALPPMAVHKAHLKNELF